MSHPHEGNCLPQTQIGIFHPFTIHRQLQLVCSGQAYCQRPSARLAGFQIELTRIGKGSPPPLPWLTLSSSTVGLGDTILTSASVGCFIGRQTTASSFPVMTVLEMWIKTLGEPRMVKDSHFSGAHLVYRRRYTSGRLASLGGSGVQGQPSSLHPSYGDRGT